MPKVTFLQSPTAPVPAKVNSAPIGAKRRKSVATVDTTLLREEPTPTE